MTTSLKTITRQLSVYSDFPVNREYSLHEYSKLDAKLTMDLFPILYEQVKKPKPQKTHSRERTNSVRRRAGHKRSKPKYFWGKKKRAQMGWNV